MNLSGLNICVHHRMSQQEKTDSINERKGALEMLGSALLDIQYMWHIMIDSRTKHPGAQGNCTAKAFFI